MSTGIPNKRKVIKLKKEIITKTMLTGKLSDLESKFLLYLEEKPLNIQCASLDEGSLYTVFISISDGLSRAHVCHSSSNTFDSAWKKVCNKAQEMIEKFEITPAWVKADLVTHVQKIPFSSMASVFLSAKFGKFFRMGFAVDNKMEYAFLEAEANSYKIYDYTLIPLKASKPGHDKVPCINVPQMIHYLQWNNQPVMDSLGKDIWVFNCESFFCDENKNTYRLYDSGIHCGRRILDEVDDQVSVDVITTATNHLIRQIKTNGSFIYGYYPSFNSVMNSYNILRHVGTLWSMMCAYDVTKDENIKPVVMKALDFVETQIQYKDMNTAFLVEAKSKEIKLGGLGVSIIALSKYMETYGDRDYTELIRKLAEGILYLQNPETGKLTHVLSSIDYSVVEEMRTVYYDGESSYALVKAYEITGDEKYLSAAGLSINYFIEENYIKYRDHWLAYALNEYTKFVPEERYYTFALKNFWENRKKINDQETSYHTYLELLMETYELYLRIKEEKIDVPYMKKVDEDEFIKIIKHRAWHMLDGYFYPEYAMYMSKPYTILGSFFVRHDGFRTRIDDDQHFIDGYAKYWKLITPAGKNIGK